MIYQHNGTGVLTRIPEFRLAGIPILANRVSFRSFQNVEGLYVIDNLANLARLNRLNLKASFSSIEVYRKRREEQINWIKQFFKEIHLDNSKNM